MKGVSPFLTQTLFIALSAFLLFAVLGIMNNMSDQYRIYSSDVETEQICLTIRSSLEKIYVDSNYPSLKNVTYGKININLPEKMGGTGYIVKFSGQNIFIESHAASKNYTCNTRFDFSYSGSSTGGMTEIKYTYNVNGTKLMEMKKL